MLTPADELESLFRQELQTQDEELRRQAAMATLHRLNPTNRLTVEQFFQDLQRHKDLWSVASGMGILDFVAILLGGRSPASAESAKPERTRRTRLTDDAKTALKVAIARVLTSAADGMSRTDLGRAIAEQGLAPSSVDQAELADKLRLPLSELVSEGRLHTVGEKRLMRYVAGGGKKR